MRLKRFLKQLTRYVLLPLLALFLMTVLIITGYVVVEKQRTASAIAIDKTTGIQVLEQVTLGGMKQWISIRGQDRAAPVLLFLHGGPGATEMVPVRHYNRKLEDHFVVVNWDQRGAGKSYAPDIPLQLEQFVADTLELTQILQDRFEQERVYLVGHSWGTIVGTHAAQHHPEYYHAYIGIGQAVNFVEAEKISYQFTLDRARELQNTVALSQLQAIGPPPYTGDDFRRSLGIQRKWLFQFGGQVYGETSNARYIFNLIRLHLIAPEYSLGDVIRFVQGNAFSGTTLWDTLMATDLPTAVPRLELPVYFLTGRHDYVTVFEKIEEYFAVLEAPYKEIVWFEESAHSPNFEEPAAFARAMIRIKDETLPADSQN